MEEVTYKGAKLSVEEFLQKIFGYVPTSKIKTSIEELKSYADIKVFDKENLKKLQTLTTAQELQDFILNPKMQNLQVKDFLIHVLNVKALKFRANAFKHCNKEHIALIVSSIFDFGEKSPDSPDSDTKNGKVEKPYPGTEDGGDDKPKSDDKPLKIDLYAMKRILKGCKFILRKDIDVTQFELTERMPVTLMDNFNMNIPQDLNIYYGAMAILTKDTQTKIAAAGYLQFYEGYPHIILQDENIEYDFFSDRTAFYIAIFPQSAKEQLENENDYSDEVYLAEAQIDLKPLEKADTTLCIDFGTSNTTVGTYGVKKSADNKQEIVPEIVEFLDETGDKPQYRKMLPTVVYVDSFTDDRVKYLFGYEALKRVIDNDYTPQASVFYEIKRWINSIDDEEFLIDEKGNKSKTKISHRDIIKAYLEHVLRLAEQHFKRKFTKVHFTAPVKLKDSFIVEITKMFAKDGRTVLSASESIDEGIAIIYNHIAEQMKKKVRDNANDKNKKADDADDKAQKVLIIDCGGGTTDLASCEYTLNTKGYSKKIDIVTRFENGDSNFGGNNVTFRIFQLLKIKLAQKLKAETAQLKSDEEVSVQNLIDDENNLLYKIDKNHDENPPPEDDRKICYEKFNVEYEKAEKFVPTKFAAESFNNKKNQLKRNFYYLWQMAEAYKVQFYRASMDFVRVDFDNAEDKKIGIPDDNKYYLYIRRNEDSELEKIENPMSGIEVTNNEIHRLLYADIYALLKNVLYTYDTSNNEQELLKYNHYKLSGQSCKITLFNELLKEFIPGKYLRYGEDKKDSFDSIELKLACINGSIYYIRDTEYGEIKPHITMETPNLIYDVCKVDVDDNISVLMLNSHTDKIEPTVDVISSNAYRVRYAVIAQNGKRQNTVDFEIERGHDTLTNTDEICRGIAWHSNDEDGAIGRYVRNELRAINLGKENPESVFALFTIPSKNGYGFYVYCVKVQNQEERYFMTQKPKYYAFENTKLETFFNGDR